MKTKFYQNLEAAKLKQPKRIELGLVDDLENAQKNADKVTDEIQKLNTQIQKLFTEGAGPDAKPLLQLLFPTPEQKAARKEAKEPSWLGI